MTTGPDIPAARELEDRGIPHRLVPYGHVSSAQEAADQRGIALSALAKTLVVRVEERSYVLVLVPGDRGLDYGKLRAHLGVRRLTMPDRAEAEAATGYAPGTITPLGAGDHEVVVDRSLLAHEEISLGSGVQNWAIHREPGHLITMGAQVADVAK